MKPKKANVPSQRVKRLVGCAIMPMDGQDFLLFEIQEKNGHKYSVYLSGIIKGFGDGAVVMNYAFPLFSKWVAKPVMEKKEVKLICRAMGLLAVGGPKCRHDALAILDKLRTDYFKKRKKK